MGLEHESLLLELNGRPADELYPLLQQVEVEVDDELAAQFRLLLAMNQLPDGTWENLDDGFQLWDKILIKAGFDDQTEPIITGYITHIQPHFAPDATNCVLEVWGMDGSVLLDQEEKVKDWQNKSDSDIAREIFGLYGMSGGNIKSTTTVHQEPVSTIIQRESDMQFLQRLARRNGFECFVEHDKGYFRPPQVDATPQPPLAVHFGEEETNVHTFTVVQNGLTAVDVTLHQIDRVKKEILRVEVNSSQQRTLGSRDAPSVARQGGRRKMGAFISSHVTSSMAELNTLAQAVYDHASWFVSGDGLIMANQYGHVLQARQPVTIKGIGESYSGVYYVTHVTHLFTDNGYTQSFRVKRNGIGLTGLENFTGINGSLLDGLF